MNSDTVYLGIASHPTSEGLSLTRHLPQALPSPNLPTQVPVARFETMTFYNQPYACQFLKGCTIRTGGLCQIISHLDLWKGLCQMDLDDKFRSETTFLAPVKSA